MISISDFGALWAVLAPPDLPAPVTEYRFHPVRRWRFDFAWPAGRGGLAVEVDGGQWRSGGGRHNGDADRLKLNVAAALGWRVLRFSHQALECDPAGCVELAVAALILGGERSAGELREDDDLFGADLPGMETGGSAASLCFVEPDCIKGRKIAYLQS